MQNYSTLSLLGLKCDFLFTIVLFWRHDMVFLQRVGSALFLKYPWRQLEVEIARRCACI